MPQFKNRQEAILYYEKATENQRIKVKEELDKLLALRETLNFNKRELYKENQQKRGNLRI